MLNITNHQVKANQNHSWDIISTCQSDCYQKDKKQQVLARIWRKGNPDELLVGMYIGTAIMESGMEIPFKKKLEIELLYYPEIPLLNIYLKKTKQPKHLFSNLHLEWSFENTVLLWGLRNCKKTKFDSIE